MAAIRKTVTVTPEQNDWIKAQVDAGDYANDSELFRDLIRREQARKAELDWLRAEIQKGRESGVSDKTAKETLDEVKAQWKAENGGV